MSHHFLLLQRFSQIVHSVGTSAPKQTVVSLRQIHSHKILHVDKSPIKDQPADGMICNQPGINLAIYTADCIPIFMFDPHANAIGLVHAGWQGVDQGIHTRAVKELEAAYRSSAQDIIVGLGPGICPKCYGFKQPPQQVNQIRWRPFISHENNSWQVSLKGLIKTELLAVGIKDQNIEDMNICTYEDHRFPSHRRSQATSEPEGRLISVIGLTSNEVID